MSTINTTIEMPISGSTFTSMFTHIIVCRTHSNLMDRRQAIDSNTYLVNEFMSFSDALPSMWSIASSASDNYVTGNNEEGEDADTILDTNNSRSEVYRKGDTRFEHDGKLYEVLSLEELDEDELITLSKINEDSFVVVSED